MLRLARVSQESGMVCLAGDLGSFQAKEDHMTSS